VLQCSAAPAVGRDHGDEIPKPEQLMSLALSVTRSQAAVLQEILSSVTRSQCRHGNHDVDASLITMSTILDRKPSLVWRPRRNKRSIETTAELPLLREPILPSSWKWEQMQDAGG
jgi:hypothetical protein